MPFDAVRVCPSTAEPLAVGGSAAMGGRSEGTEGEEGAEPVPVDGKLLGGVVVKVAPGPSPDWGGALASTAEVGVPFAEAETGHRADRPLTRVAAVPTLRS